jgi:hypothetical protein
MVTVVTIGTFTLTEVVVVVRAATLITETEVYSHSKKFVWLCEM